MALCAAVPVTVTEKQRQQLEALVRQRQAPQSVVMRARIVLLAAAGLGVRETAAQLRLGRSTVQRWREQWRIREGLAVAERLGDAPRCGTPPTFTPEQICAIVALACESPSRRGHPLTHWTQVDLAAEAVERGIVTSISPHSVGRFLRELDLTNSISNPIACAAG
jgi:transposase